MNPSVRAAAMGLGLAALAAIPTAAYGQTVQGESEYPRIRIQGRMQPQFYYLDNKPYSDEVGPTNQIFLRRARFRFRVYLRDDLSVMLNPSFEGSPAEVRIQDAYIDLRLSRKDSRLYALFRVGQLKTRFGRYENKSSTNLPSLERGGGAGMVGGASNDLFKSAGFLGRDVGAVFFLGSTTSPAHWGHGKPAGGGEPSKHPWGLAISMFNGQGASASDVNNTKSFGARGSFRVLPKLDLGAAVYRHDGIVGADSSFTNIAYGFEAEWGTLAAPGLWLDFEAMYGQAFTTAEPWMLGLTLIGAYHIRMPEGHVFYALEPAGQLDMGDPATDTNNDRTYLWRIGLNAYLTPQTQFRFMFENMSFQADGAESIFGIRTGITISW
ncbi:MAG: porin [Gemmatimonadales bacterium]